MKKILVTTNLITALALCSILFTACPEKKDLPDVTNTCTPCKGTLPPSSVAINYFKALISNYRNNHWQTINTNLNNRSGAVDSRSVWFNLNQLKGFIYEIEKNVAANCQGNHCGKELGIRIYFGEYDNTTNPTYAGYHTLVMVPTMKNPNREKWNTPEENIDFDYSILNKCQPACPDSSIQSLMALLPDFGNTSMGAMNHGGLIPPPDRVCTGARFMDYVDYSDGIKPLCTCP